MAGAIFRVRSRIKKMREGTAGITHGALLAEIAQMIDEEIERDAEFEFRRPMNPNPVTAMAKEKR